MSGLGIIRGKLVVLRPATVEDRRSVYDWYACSDATHEMIGPPTYPERPIPTWEEFQAESADALHYFDDTAPLRGRSFIILKGGETAGVVTYNDIVEGDRHNRVELDIWMRSEADCGKGYGTDALDALCRALSQRFRVKEFMVQPSARNPRAIRAYEKIGFVKLNLPIEQARQLWGPSDYDDSVYLVRTLPGNDPPDE